jgi:hypothetical protein
MTVFGEKLYHCHIIILFLKGKYNPHILNVQKCSKNVGSKLLWNVGIHIRDYET